jgi:hypothetical protein
VFGLWNRINRISDFNIICGYYPISDENNRILTGYIRWIYQTDSIRIQTLPAQHHFHELSLILLFGLRIRIVTNRPLEIEFNVTIPYE